MTIGTAGSTERAPIRKGRLKSRGIRKPTHPYSVEQEAFDITPHFIAPVLAGETLVSLTDQSRSVSDPVKNKLKGWWMEKSYFYVALSKLKSRSTFMNMMIDYDEVTSGAHTTAQVKTYHEADTIDFVAECLEAIVDFYYRDSEETWNTPSIGGIPTARLSRRNFMNSYMTEAVYEALDVAIADTGLEAREVTEAFDEWEFKRKVEGEKWNYADYLRDQGVSVPRELQAQNVSNVIANVPERLMTQIEWSFPTNTVDETDGSVTSAVIWSPKVRIKDKFFNEPGFILGITVVRPKVYFIKQTSTATALLDTAAAWLPSIFEDNPESTMLKIAIGKPPYSAATGASVLDIKDLFLHGEQFVNHVIDSSDNGINTPEVDGDRGYALTADLAALFVTGGVDQIRTDGRVSMRIRSHVRETSAPTSKGT